MAEIEFFVPDDNATPKPVAKALEGEASDLDDAVAPALEVTLPEVEEVDDPSKVMPMLPSRNEVMMASRALADPDDPTVLLQGMLGQMPGVYAGRAADMAVNADIALNNLGVKAKRLAKLAERAERAKKAEQLEGKKKRRRK